MSKENWEKELEKHEQFDRLEKNVWNAAIEAAIEKVRFDHTIYHIIDEIRKLKR